MGAYLNNQKGVTLIELIITLAIALIFAGVVSASLTSSDIRALDAAATGLQSDLRYAQRMSVVEGRRYQVIFNLVDNYYEVRRRDLGSASSFEKIKIVNLQDGVKLQSMNDPLKTVEYTPTGTTGDACTIVLYGKSHRINLTVAVGSGRIEKKEIKKI